MGEGGCLKHKRLVRNGVGIQGWGMGKWRGAGGGVGGGRVLEEVWRKNGREEDG